MSSIRPIRAYLNREIPTEIPSNLPANRGLEEKLGLELPSWLLVLGLYSKSRINEHFFGSEAPTATTVISIRDALADYGYHLLDLVIRVSSFTELQLSDPKILSSRAEQLREFALCWVDSLSLRDHLLFGTSDEKDASETLPVESAYILASGVALIRGFPHLRGLLRSLNSRLASRHQVRQLDNKTTLQELSQERYRSLPRYELLRTHGPDHEKLFDVRASVPGCSVVASGTSKKKAEQAAASRLLKEIGRGPVSSSRTADRWIPLDQHRIPELQERRLRAAEELLGYRFRNKRLLSSALTHASFVFETKRNQHLDYRPLASIGSAIAAVKAREALLNSEGFPAGKGITEIKISELIARDVLGASTLARSLTELALFGRGQQRNRPSERISSDIIQAVLAAAFLDAEESLEALNLPSIDALFSSQLQPEGDLLSRVQDFKTRLQEIMQAVGQGPPTYSSVRKGPHHASTFNALLELEFRERTVRFPGEGKSRRAAEHDAARNCVELLARLTSLPADPADPAESRELSPDECSFSREIIQAMLMAAQRGSLGWSRVSRIGMPLFTVLQSADYPAIRDALIRWHALFGMLDLSHGADALLEALENCPRPPAPKLAALIDLLQTVESTYVLRGIGMRAKVSKREKVLSQLGVAISLLRASANTESSVCGVDEIYEAMDFLRTRHSGLVVDLARLQSTYAHPMVLDLTAALLAILDPSPRGGDLEVYLSTHAQGIRVEINREGPLPPDIADTLEWTGQFLEEVASGGGIYIEKNSVGALIPGVESLAAPQGDHWVGQAMQRILVRHSSDGKLLARTGQLLHDLKNLIVALERFEAEGLASSAEKYRLLAQAEEVQAQLRASVQLALRWVGQTRNIEPKVLDLSSLLRSFAGRLTQSTPSSIAVRTELDNRQVWASGDDKLLLSLLDNLTRNAVEAMSAGGSLAFEWIYDKGSGGAIIQVSDTGPGIPAEVTAAINAGLLPPSGKGRGRGFGLASVLHIVELHNGRLFLDGHEAGSVATLILPAEPDDAAPYGAWRRL